MERSCCAVIVAAGGSTRMGCPKQTLVLEGASVIAWTLRAFEEAGSVSSIVLVIREEDKAAMEDMVARYGISKPVFFAAGGRERQLPCIMACLLCRLMRNMWRCMTARGFW